MKEIKINVDNYNENSIKTIEGNNLSEVYKIYICKNKRRIDLTNKIAVMAYVDEYGSKRSNILNLNITNAAEGEIELPITNVISRENGVYACEIAIYGENNFLEQTAPFSLIVENNIFSKISNTAINSSDFHILSEAIKTTNAYGEKLKQGTEKIELQYASKLDLKANESDLVIERKRIDNIVSIPEGTPNAAELIDSRIGADGVTYDNLGNAIRTQFKDSNINTGQIRKLLLKGTIDLQITNKDNAYLTQDGSFNSDERLHCKVTNKIYCEEDWKFSYDGRADALAVSYLMYRGNTIVSFGQHNSKTEITIPKGIDGIVFASYNYKDRDIVLNVSLISPNIIIEDNLIPNLESKVGVSELNNEVRDVLSYINTPITKDTMTKLENKYASVGGDVVTANGYCCYEIPVKEGEIYSYMGTIIYNLAPYHLCDSDKTVVVGGDKQQHSEITTFEYPYLIIPKGINRLRVCSGSGKGDAPMTLIKKTPSPSLKSEDVEEAINSHIYEGLGELENITPRYSTQNGVYLRGDGTLATDSSGQVTDFINIDDLHTIYINAHAKYLTRILAIYDSEKSFLAIKGVPEEYNTSLIWNKEPIKIKTILKEHPNAKYIRIGTYQYESHPIRIYQKRSTLVETIKYLEAKIDEVGKQSNILYGKKYVACGDSFTEGDFRGFEDEHGLTGTNSPVIYDEEMRCYKTYPWWIAKRNNMTLVNEAICGSTMALSKEYLEGTKDDINYRNPFSLSRYKKVPLDTDYLTLWFGLNETSTPLGTLQDTDNRTILGAWNIVLEYFITNMPYCKIGIVISDGGLRDEFANGIISVAEYWGIPYLDLRNDPKVPLMLGGRGGRINLNPKAKQLRNKAFYVTSSNGHPNLEAHKYQSTFIENWLRSL